MGEDTFHRCKTIMWYDQYCENYYSRGFKDYTVESVMHDLDEVDADVYAIYATNQWGMAYYDSSVVPKYAPLGERDYFGEVVAELKKRGKKVIAYINWLDSRHPEWHWQSLTQQGIHRLDPDGLEEVPGYESQRKGKVYKRHYGQWFCHCINSPRRDEILGLAREITEKYPVDVFHLDMFSNYGICACSYCWPHLEEMLGTSDITYDAVLNKWGEYLAWRREVSVSLIRQIGDIVHSKGVLFAPNAWCPLYTDPVMGVSPAWWDHIDLYLTEAWLRLAQHYADIHSTTIVCKWLRALGIPGILLITGQHPGFSHAPLAAEEFKVHAAVARGNGMPILGPCGQGAYPSTRTSGAGLGNVRRVFEFYKGADENKRVGKNGAATGDAAKRESVRHIGIVWSDESQAFYQPGVNTTLYRFEFHGFCRLLLETQRVFDVILPERISSPKDISDYELVVFPNTACMSEAFAATIREYVAGGGKILCTWDTSLCNSKGEKRADFLLSDVLGVKYRGKYSNSTFYIETGPEPCLCLGQAVLVEPTTATVCRRLVEPDPDYPDTGRDLVPGAVSDWPMLTQNPFGNGEAWYLAGSLGYSVYQTGHYQMMDLLAGIMDDMRLKDWLTIDGPSTVDVSVEKDDRDNLYIHLANKTVPPYLPGRNIVRSVDSIIPVADVRIQLRGTIRPTDVSASDDIEIVAVPGGIKCLIPKLEDYLLITVSEGARNWTLR